MSFWRIHLSLYFHPCGESLCVLIAAIGLYIGIEFADLLGTFTNFFALPVVLFAGSKEIRAAQRILPCHNIIQSHIGIAQNIIEHRKGRGAAMAGMTMKMQPFNFDTKRNIHNANFLKVAANFSTKRSLMSVPTDTYGYATCKEIDLGDVYDVIPVVIAEGTTQIEGRFASQSHNYCAWQNYVPQKITCRYLQVRLKVNGYCRAASIKIKVPVQEETIAQDIKAESTTIQFTNNYYKVPAIFPAYSNNNLVIEKVTKKYCIVHINDSTGKKAAGQVTLLVRG